MVKKEVKEWVLSDKHGELYYHEGTREEAEGYAMEHSLIVDGETE